MPSRTVRPGTYLFRPQLASLAPVAPPGFNPTGSAITVRLPPRPPAIPPSSRDTATPDGDRPLHQSVDLDANKPPDVPDIFFDELYEAIMMPATPIPTEHVAAGLTPPRSTATFTVLTSSFSGNPAPGPDPMDEILASATKQSDPQSQASRTFCNQPDCPMAQRYHLQGVYIHEGIPPPSRLETFGKSNPPPSVWEAIYKGCNWVGTQEDADLISRFLEYHAIGGNFLLAPHTNFLWGEEANTPYAVPSAPVVRLPFPTLPCRIYFDAAPNLTTLPELPYIRDIDNPTFRRCVDPICPIAGEHSQGVYLHNDEPPRILAVAFGHSNPPPSIWEALERVARADHYGLKASSSDRWVVVNFQKLHVGGVVDDWAV